MQNPPVIRAFISDLDDTLLTRDCRMTDRTAETLRRLMRQGIPVILASGRSTASVRQYVRQIGSTYPYIGSNGAEIADGKTDEIIHADRVPLPLAVEALKWLEARGIYAQLYHGDDWFCAKWCEISDIYGRDTGVIGTCAGMPLSQFIKADAAKILGVDTKERIPGLIAEMKAEFGDKLSITTSKPHFMEITSPTANKGNAAAWVANLLGVTAEDTVCAGDSLNDMTMLRWSRLPVAVSNARAEVKEICWRVAGDGREDGIAALLDELIPEGTK